MGYHDTVIYLRALLELIDVLHTPPPAPRWPCPAAWLELQLYRLGWTVPDAGRRSDRDAERNRSHSLLAAQRVTVPIGLVRDTRHTADVLRERGGSLVIYPTCPACGGTTGYSAYYHAHPPGP